MKNDLIYQDTSYTCAPTTILNALRYLYEREELRPDLIWTVYRLTMDCYGADGTFGTEGTSPKAVLSVANALNMFGESNRFPIQATVLRDDQALVGSPQANTPLRRTIVEGGAGVARVWSNNMNGHYVLVTGFSQMPDGTPAVRVFDPLQGAAVDGDDVLRIEGEPRCANRLVSVSLFDSGSRKPFALVNDENKRRVICISHR
ncbi:hypothetical protein [Bifidobacterium bombi]|uniref:Peptidase C39-like domain-containing protein n=1 Tax=Bifidobacterium bombi DSM 19703 TaxID=1341695 RepID=A0A086BP95_9BIFI|nr:hypothetical protein [Bifidobacterium bombi]KFF30759.1 hypothetical protein BBOMB_0066 [Bifidobacterium bombi DSM 19703]